MICFVYIAVGFLTLVETIAVNNFLMGTTRKYQQAVLLQIHRETFVYLFVANDVDLSV